MAESLLLKVLRGDKTERPPIWYMRQAGRVLPSYLKLKEKHSFWEMMQNKELASKVTLLPVHDLGVDAAILFSDILVIPYAMGMGLDFTDKGPVFEHPLKEFDKPLKQLDPKPEQLQYIYNAINQIINTKPKNIPLIGFCGAPLTVLTFMLQGLGSRSDFLDAIKFFFKEKETTKKLVEIVTELSINYIHKQIDSEIEVFQLFDTNAGLIPNDLYFEIFMPAVKKIAKEVRCRNIPFIFFPKGIGVGIKNINYDVCDFLSVDWQTPIEAARKLLDPKVGIQGNLDPRILFADKKMIESELHKQINFGRRHKDWIFNLGHGFLPNTSFENAKFITDFMKSQRYD